MARSRHGGSIIGERLAKHGVRHLFTLCGGHISPILTGAKEHGIEVVDVRDEATAAFAADASARMTGTVGVAAVTAGPGVTNTITAVKNAQMAQSPLIVFGGAAATILRGRGSLQDIDQMTLMAPLVKWTARVTTVSALAPVVDRAVEIATSGVPGPVFIEVPVDVLYPEEIVREWYVAESGVEKMKGVAGKALSLYLRGHLARQFHAPHVDLELPALQEMFSFGDSGASREIDTLAAAVRKAKKPVVVVGSQALVNFTRDDAERLAGAAERLGMPVFLGGMARGLLGRHSDIQFRHKRTAALKEADLVIIAGFPFDFRLGYGQKINRRATVASANLSAEDLRKNRKPEIALQMHPGEMLVELSRRVSKQTGAWDGWFQALREREQKRDEEIAADAGAEELVNPVDLFLRMEEKLDDDSVLIVDGGDFVATGSYILRPRGPLSWLDPGVFGTLGVGGGFALGAQLARRGAEVWLLWGDGSSAYSLAEFDTYVRHGLAPIAVVGTDASWGQIARDQIKILDDDVATTLRRTDYHTVAEGYGGKGLLLRDASKIDEVLDEAKALAKAGTPVLINVHLAKSDFREGSLSM